MTTNTDLMMSRFSHALSSPIHNRCAELTVLIDRNSSKDLQNLFPTLMENIFGTSGGMSWGIRNISQSTNPKDFEILHHFLGPLGPIFRLIYKILTECQVKYEFSVAHLPSKIRYMLEHSKVPPFYTDLLNLDSQSRKVYSLSLNAFDFYMFHFAYHLTNPWQQRIQYVWGTWNTVYYVLSCDYMVHFLPFDPNSTVLPQLTHFTGKNPLVITPQSVINRPQRTSKVLRNHILQQTSAEISTLHQPMQQHPRGEIWRSETVVQVFIDIWLNNDQLSNVDNSFNSQSKVNDLPSGEYIKILRILVKQLHAFSASAKNDTTPMGELKKVVQPMLQGRMYAFLRHLVYRWPLDGSFRLVLELWLSFIQPWRYLPENLSKNRDTDTDEKDNNPIIKSNKVVEREYQDFIAENLLAYTVIFQQLLTRLSRIDLASPKNSLMLFRVTKVFSQVNLVPMIQEIESWINCLNNSPTHSYVSSYSTFLPPLSPTTCWSTNTSNVLDVTNQSRTSKPIYSPERSTLDESRCNIMGNKFRTAAVVRHKMFEYEGPEFCYKPMFVCGAAPEVYQLLRCIQIAENVAMETIRIRMQEQQVNNGGVLGFIKSIFMTEETSDEFSLEERKKVISYLSFAQQNLIEIFKLNVSNFKQMDITLDNSGSLNNPINQATPVKPNLDMSPTGARKRLRYLKYEGDPDLHPIRSTENAFMVRILYHLAQKINTTYYHQMQTAYNRRDFLGRMTRNILLPPLVTYSYDKSVPGVSPRVQKLLPARISLRFFASHYILACTFVLFMFAKIFGFSTFIICFLGLFVWFMTITAKSICNITVGTEMNESFNDISF